MLIDHTKIRIPKNFVLIAPDKDYDKYHNEKGEETQFIAPSTFRNAIDANSEYNYEEEDIIDTFSHNFSYSGTVIACPEKLVFLGREVKKYLEENQHNLGYAEKQTEESDHRAIKAAATIIKKVEDMNADSVDKLSDIDIEKGDRVYFDYLERFKVYQEARVIKTDIGDLFLIKYDKLELRIRDNEIKPLNGWVFVKWERQKDIQYGSLFLAGPEKRIEETVGIQSCPIAYLSDPIHSHLDDLDFDDPCRYLKVGDVISFRSQHASNIEGDNHFTLFGGKELLKIQSKEILGWQN